MDTLLTDQVPVISTGTGPWDLGLVITFDVPGRIVAIRYWKLATDKGLHVGRLWTATGALSSVKFKNETDSGWQQAPIALKVAKGDTVTVSVVSDDHFAVLANGAEDALQTGNMSAGASGSVYGRVGRQPTMPSPHLYFRDVVFVPDPFCGVPCP